MQYSKIEGIDKPVARLVLGTMIINSNELEKSFKLLDEAVELGYTTFDTAHGYQSEWPIGQWMESRKAREKVVIITKGAHPSRDRKRVTPFDITADLHDSLARLKTDYIDLYLLHRDDTDLPVGPIVEILNEHYRAGKIRAFGGSNWTHERIQEANDYAKAHGLVPFIASSPHYSLAEQVEEPWAPGCIAISGPNETKAREWYENNQMPVFAYSSLARGFFSGRITREVYEKSKETIDQACLTAYCHEQNFKRLDRVFKLAEEKGVSVPQIALAYILNQKMNVFPIVGAANREEMKSNLEVLDIKLTSEELSWLNLER
ncbi:aldo/keto reductase [Clostridium sp. SYSU_GA19001]|uniref:aldo/keto reductase n=1 Tax=Clostridium caldaquaticum TaxID=2940653 RepID=UPI0020779A9B|nr:aldo/keto reductase [Clostridium caldaquaticum]MCM8709945.1 aldo/keto reductase [Clostridium caldaquaticum]